MPGVDVDSSASKTVENVDWTYRVTARAALRAFARAWLARHDAAVHNALHFMTLVSLAVARASPPATRRPPPASTFDRRRFLGLTTCVFAAHASPARAEGLLPLDVYLARLETCATQIDALASELEGGERTSAKDYGRLRAKLHEGELGRFWVTARGCDRRTSREDTGAERSPFAREKADLWALVPEKSGPIGRALRPNFDDPDDRLCLVYSCVNDPSAPSSIDTLYALKLLDEGLRIGAKGDKVTAEGLSYVAREAGDKLASYAMLVKEKADASFVDESWVNPAPATWSGRGI